MSLLNAEMDLWFKKWVTATDENLLSSALQVCDNNTHPNVYFALYLISVMPMSVVSFERSFFNP